MTSIEHFDEGVVIAGRYRVLREIGRGGMGQVVLARDERLARLVALKRCPLRHNGEDLQQQVRVEARVAAGAIHVNLARLYDVLAYDDCHIMVSEYIAGLSLDRHLAETRLSAGDAISIALQCARALACLHRQGIYHRDMKPQNILIAHEDDACIVKVIDFGISKIMRGNLTVAAGGGRLCLTVDYASPEQSIEYLAECRYGYEEEFLPARVDARSDVWALAIILHEMLTGQHPFPDLPEEQIARLRETARCPSPTNRIEHAGLRELVERALAPYPARVSSIEAFAGELACIQRAHERQGLSRWLASFLPARSKVAGAIGLTLGLSGAPQDALATPEQPPLTAARVLASVHSAPAAESAAEPALGAEPMLGTVSTLELPCAIHDGWIKFRAAPNARAKIVASAQIGPSVLLPVRAVQSVLGVPQWLETEHAPGQFGWMHINAAEVIELHARRFHCRCVLDAVRCEAE